MMTSVIIMTVIVVVLVIVAVMTIHDIDMFLSCLINTVRV